MKLKSYLSIGTLLAISLNLSACFERPKSHTSEKPSSTIEGILEGLSPKNSAKDCASVVLMEGIPPQIQQATLNNNTRNLCFEEFALKHSGISKGPLWVAEYLTPEKVAKKVKRQGEFHAETRLPAAARAELADYRGSGYDRGHLAPSGNMSTKSAQQDSFSLANMVPQNPKNNQQAWRNIEEAVREIVQNSNEPVYLITGVAFLNAKVATIGANKVFVPSHLYKAVYQPISGVIGAYWIANTASAQAQIISVCDLESKTGVNVFPMLSKGERRQKYDLPTTGAAVDKRGNIANLGRDAANQCSNKLSAAEAAKLATSFSH